MPPSSRHTKSILSILNKDGGLRIPSLELRIPCFCRDVKLSASEDHVDKALLKTMEWAR